MKKAGIKPSTDYHDIECFKNTGMGIYISVFAFLLGFGIVWQIIWLIGASFIGIIACLVRLSFDDEMEYMLPAREVRKIEEAYDSTGT